MELLLIMCLPRLGPFFFFFSGKKFPTWSLHTTGIRLSFGGQPPRRREQSNTHYRDCPVPYVIHNEINEICRIPYENASRTGLGNLCNESLVPILESPQG